MGKIVLLVITSQPKNHQTDSNFYVSKFDFLIFKIYIFNITLRNNAKKKIIKNFQCQLPNPASIC